MKEELGKDKPSGKKSVLVPFLIGGLVGAAVGILLAPRSGRETREQIKDFASDTKSKVTSTIDKGKIMYDDAKIALSSAVDAGKQAYAQERDKVVANPS